MCEGGWGWLKVRMTVFVFLLPSSLPSFTEIMTASVTPWDFNSDVISATSQLANSRDRTTPLHEFNVRWGVTFTGTCARDSIFSSMLAYVALSVCTRMSPRWSLFTLTSVPMLAFNALPRAKADRLVKGTLSSTPWITNHLVKLGITSSEAPESGQLRLIDCLRLLAQCNE